MESQSFQIYIPVSYTHLDVYKRQMVRSGIGSDTRIGRKFLYPAIGDGGSCFPKHVKAFIKTAEQNGYQMRVLRAVVAVSYTHLRHDELLIGNRPVDAQCRIIVYYGGFRLRSIYTVSYTHLDVYKRQGINWTPSYRWNLPIL